jgi:hypothetical protein
MRPLVLLPLSLSLVVACSSSSNGSDSGSAGAAPDQAALDAYCPHLCTTQQKCTHEDGVACLSDCQKKLAYDGAKLRADFLSGKLACLDAVACTSWSTDSARCPNKVHDTMTPTKTASDWCASWSQKWKDCGRPAVPSVSQCLAVYKLYNDPAFTVAGPCLSKPCDTFQACVEGALGPL